MYTVHSCPANVERVLSGRTVKKADQVPAPTELIFRWGETENTPYECWIVVESENQKRRKD